MMECGTCGSSCSGVCDSKVAELAAIVGPLGTEAIRRLLNGADGDVNRAINHFFDSGAAPAVPLPPPSADEVQVIPSDEEPDSKHHGSHTDHHNNHSNHDDDDDSDESDDQERLIKMLLEHTRHYPLDTPSSSNRSSPSSSMPFIDVDSDSGDDDDMGIPMFAYPRGRSFFKRGRGHWSDSEDDSDSDTGIVGGRSSPIEVHAAPKAGSIKIHVEKDENPNVFEYLTRLNSTKPAEYDYMWNAESLDYRETYENRLAEFKKGKLENNLPLTKLNRNVAEIYSEVVDGIKVGELMAYLSRYVTKRRINVDTECSAEKSVFDLTLKVNFLPSFFTAKKNSAFARTLFDLLEHKVEPKPATPVSISAAKPLGDGLIGHYVVNTAELYKYMESDGYPVSVTDAMLTDLRVELREYQKQVVSWMIDRENLDVGMCDAFWETRKLPNGETYYYCPISSRISIKAPSKVKGGILCEEMGLGKTVEIIALILANSPFKKQPNFFQRNNTTNSNTTTTTTTTTTQFQIENDDESQQTKKLRTTKRGRSPRTNTTTTTTTTISRNKEEGEEEGGGGKDTPTTTRSSSAKGSVRRSQRPKRGVSYSDQDWSKDSEMKEEGGEDYKEDKVASAANSEDEEDNVFKEAVKPGKSLRSKKRKKEEVAEEEVDHELQQQVEREIELEIEQERTRQKEREKEKKEKEKEAKAKAEAEAAEKAKEQEAEKDKQPEISNTFITPAKKGKEPVVPFPAEDLVQSKATLIVSLLRQWENELRQKVRPGSLRILQYHGPKRSRDVIKIAKGYDIVLTSYTIITTDRTYQKNTPEGPTSPWGPLERIHWHRIVLDEAHYVKSPVTVISRLCRILAGSIKWAVTGTPIQNAITDIVGIFDFLNLEPFRTKHSFNNLDTHQLLEVLRHLVMRHTKEQRMGGKPLVALPPRTERVVYSEMTSDERELYTHLYSICSVKFNALAHQNAVASHYTYVMSSLILPLRQMCAHVSLVNAERFIDDTGGGAKRQREGPQAPALTEDVDLKPALEKMRKGDRTEITEILSKSGHPECPICLEVSDLPTVTPCLHLFCNGCIREIAQQGRGICPLCRTPFAETDLVDVFPSTASSSSSDGLTVTDVDPEIAALITKLQNVHSSKTAKLMEELKAIIDKDRSAKVVIFTQWTPFFKKLETQLVREGIRFTKLTGDMSMSQKGNSLTKFQSDPSISVFLLSLRSGAVGLTLTAANHLFLLDPSFNKGTEMQAINRIYRIGQTRETTITHMVAKNTIEEKIYKRNLTIHTTEQDAAHTHKENASTTELMTLFA